MSPGTQSVTYLLRRRSSGVKLVPAKIDGKVLLFTLTSVLPMLLRKFHVRWWCLHRQYAATCEMKSVCGAPPRFRNGIHTMGAAPCSSTFFISCVLVAGLPAQQCLIQQGCPFLKGSASGDLSFVR